MSVKVHRISTLIAHAYLIENEAGLYLVDTGMIRCEKLVLRRMQQLGRDDLRLIYITHAHLDHYGSAAALKRLTGAPVAVHRADGEAMARGQTPIGEVRSLGKVGAAVLRLLGPYLRLDPVRADRLFDDGETLHEYGLDAEVLHTPGHTPGSSCLMVAGRLAFAGDLLSGTLRPHVQSFYAMDWSLIPDSLRRLQERRPDLVYPGHGRSPLKGKVILSL